MQHAARQVFAMPRLGSEEALQSNYLQWPHPTNEELLAAQNALVGAGW